MTAANQRAARQLGRQCATPCIRHAALGLADGRPAACEISAVLSIRITHSCLELFMHVDSASTRCSVPSGVQLAKVGSRDSGSTHMATRQRTYLRAFDPSDATLALRVWGWGSGAARAPRHGRRTSAALGGSIGSSNAHGLPAGEVLASCALLAGRGRTLGLDQGRRSPRDPLDARRAAVPVHAYVHDSYDPFRTWRTSGQR